MPVAFQTPAEVAEVFGLTREAILQLCRAGTLGVQHRGHYYIHPDEVEEMRIARLENPPKPGRKKSDADFAIVCGLYDQGLKGDQIATKLKIHRSRVFAYLAEYRQTKESERLKAAVSQAETPS